MNRVLSGDNPALNIMENKHNFGMKREVELMSIALGVAEKS